MKHAHESVHKNYTHLAITTVVNALIMYLVMYTMIAGLPDFYNNVNQV